MLAGRRKGVDCRLTSGRRVSGLLWQARRIAERRDILLLACAGSWFGEGAAVRGKDAVSQGMMIQKGLSLAIGYLQRDRHGHVLHTSTGRAYTQAPKTRGQVVKTEMAADGV